jgi:subtilisin family serine protease
MPVPVAVIDEEGDIVQETYIAEVPEESIQATPPAPGEPNPRPAIVGRYDPERVLVELSADADATLAAEIAADYNLAIEEQRLMSFLAAQFVNYLLPDGLSVDEAVQVFADDPRIINSQPNFLFSLAGETAANSIQYAPAKIHVDEAHEIAKGRDVLVAIIDTGVDAEHPELQTAVVDHFEAIDFDPASEKRHGTAIAAVIAANSHMLGIAPSVRLLSARAFGVPKGASKASATSFAILKSMQWSFERGARILNLSFAGPRDPALMKGLDALAARDVIMVAAAGNAGPDAPPAYPGAHPGVIAVTAIDTAGVRYKKANSGKYVALAAPGVDVLTATPGNRYKLMSGTSVAAAHVTGVVALMMERYPDLKPPTVRQMLADSAIDLGPEGPDADYGAGLVDALGALEQAGRVKLVAAN